MSAVLSWVDMMKKIDLSEPTEVKITLRLGAGPVHALDEIAKDLDISRTRAATGLLEAAIVDAINKIRPLNPVDPDVAYYIEQKEKEQAEAESYIQEHEEGQERLRSYIEDPEERAAAVNLSQS